MVLAVIFRGPHKSIDKGERAYEIKTVLVIFFSPAHLSHKLHIYKISYSL